MVIDLVEIRDGSDEMRAEVSLAVVILQLAGHTYVLALAGEGFGVVRVGVRVGPLLDFDEAGAVVEFVGCVGGLGGDGLDLPDDGYGGYVDRVDYEGCFGVGEGAAEGLVGWVMGRGEETNASISCLIVTGRSASLP